jgi:hypothetical protein
VAVLEEVIRRIDVKLDRMDAKFDRVDANFQTMDARLGSLTADVAELRGIVRNLPSTWAMMTAVIGGQVALAAMLIGAARLFGVHG